MSPFELYRPRRIVTANTERGRSFILSDGPTPHVLESGPGRGLVNLWATDGDGPALAAEDGAERPVRSNLLGREPFSAFSRLRRAATRSHRGRPAKAPPPLRSNVWEPRTCASTRRAIRQCIAPRRLTTLCC